MGSYWFAGVNANVRYFFKFSCLSIDDELDVIILLRIFLNDLLFSNLLFGVLRVLFNEIKGYFLILNLLFDWVRHLLDLIRNHLLVVPVVGVLARQELLVDDFESIAHRVVLPFDCPATRQDGIVHAFEQQHFFEWIEVELSQVTIPLAYIIDSPALNI